MILSILRAPLSAIPEERPRYTMGVLSIDGVRECNTLELPWKGNQARVSCIPLGSYRVTWEKSPRLNRKTLRVHDVPGRTGILINPANYAHELNGCIALGFEARGTLVNSRYCVEAVERKALAAILAGQSVTLEILASTTLRRAPPRSLPHE